MGPAVAVLADQQQNLMKMLKALDRLGEVGTRVIGAAKDDILSDPRRPQSGAAASQRGRRLTAARAVTAAQLPVPRQGPDDRVGATTPTPRSALDISLRNFIGEDPIINPGEVLTDLQRCLRSGGLLSTACAKFLKDVDLFEKLKNACNAATLKNNPVCKAINLLPVLGGLGGLTGNSDSDSGDSGGLLGLLGLRQALTSQDGFSTSSDLYGRGL